MFRYARHVLLSITADGMRTAPSAQPVPGADAQLAFRLDIPVRYLLEIPIRYLTAGRVSSDNPGSRGLQHHINIDHFPGSAGKLLMTSGGAVFLRRGRRSGRAECADATAAGTGADGQSTGIAAFSDGPMARSRGRVAGPGRAGANDRRAPPGDRHERCPRRVRKVPVGIS